MMMMMMMMMTMTMTMVMMMMMMMMMMTMTMVMMMMMMMMMLMMTMMMMMMMMWWRRRTDLKTGKHTLGEPAQSKCAWRGYKSHFVWKFTREWRTPIPGTALCASLRSRNAHGHFTRAFCVEI